MYQRARTSPRRSGILVLWLYIVAVVNRACVGYSALVTASEQYASRAPNSLRHVQQPVSTSAQNARDAVDASHWNPVPFHEVLGTHLDSKTHRCEPVTLALCKGMYYPNTRMPNMFHHETQEEAGLEVGFYLVLVVNLSAM
ncbi:unnamed protein product [Echinostoma caproni]|uniref:Transmembrane protein n=1 Tax=Echinostoma caproni TaxID=27848 RepID=A0A183A9E3_9TREM|nr:unnamed protein product [Echinostoma caproni]